MARTKKDVSFTNDKEQGRFSEITKVMVWLTLIAAVGLTVLAAIPSF